MLKRVPQQGQLPSQQKKGSMPTMTRSSPSSTGYMAVEVYRAWGEEAQLTFSRLTTRLSVKSSVPRPEALLSIYVRLNMMLVRANARALLSRVTLG